MKAPSLVLGTRGSELALRQTDMVMAALRAAHPDLEVERKIISTTGDRRTDLRFSEFTTGGRLDKGIFTKELELALAAGEIDAAVHSLKDVPTELDPAFGIAATLPRAPIEDVLVTREGFDLASLPHGAAVGTSSVRRIRQLAWRRPDLRAVEIRGNVPTRVRKLAPPSDLAGVLLARAGLERLGLLDPACGPGATATLALDDGAFRAFVLPCSVILPAAGQGAIGIESRADDARTRELLAAINHADTFARVRAEREFLHLLKAGCQTPIGALTRIEGDAIHLQICVFGDATEPVEGSASAPLAEPEKAAAELARLFTPR